MAAQEERQRLDRDTWGGDERGGPDGPWVQQAGAQREGPVEGAGMQQPVLGRQAVPALDIIRRAQIARWAWATALGSPDEPEVKTR
jgi:hypothetical protein